MFHSAGCIVPGLLFIAHCTFSTVTLNSHTPLLLFDPASWVCLYQGSLRPGQFESSGTEVNNSLFGCQLLLQQQQQQQQQQQHRKKERKQNYPGW
ncbi:hypothetical protein BD289DRAFT_190463 [Coniella lustricola]|uniref:Secreted protein n=1 Tax=Coniella lustricola TaxID=2025994 RepID=A0A2T3ACY9_9PEZI|nr:hypothetical protein BD289DRAFT_190463 [Coniella lustricola]